MSRVRIMFLDLDPWPTLKAVVLARLIAQRDIEIVDIFQNTRRALACGGRHGRRDGLAGVDGAAPTKCSGLRKNDFQLQNGGIVLAGNMGQVARR